MPMAYATSLHTEHASILWKYSRVSKLEEYFSCIIAIQVVHLVPYIGIRCSVSDLTEVFG